VLMAVFDVLARGSIRSGEGRLRARQLGSA
jgi:hypothetical protein